MQDKQLTSIEQDINKQFYKNDDEVDLRSVCRYLSKNNFMRGKAKGRIRLNAKHLTRINGYVTNSRTIPD